MEGCENVIMSFCVIKGCQMWCKVTNDVLQMWVGGFKRKSISIFEKFVYFFQISGIGKVSEKMLNALGISNCFHLSQQMALLSLLFSETAWHHFMQVSLGLGSTHIPRYSTVCFYKTQHIRLFRGRMIMLCLVLYRHEERKSISTERYGLMRHTNTRTKLN